MKLWMSGENEGDIGNDARVARNVIEPVVNKFLESQIFFEKFEKWAFMSIILSEKFLPGFPEVAKISSKGKVLEFRVKISHGEFKMAAPLVQIEMTLDAMERSIDMMKNLKVSSESQRQLRVVLSQARKSLIDK